MPNTKQATGEPPTQAMTTGLLARSGIAVERESRPVCLVAS